MGEAQPLWVERRCKGLGLCSILVVGIDVDLGLNGTVLGPLTLSEDQNACLRREENCPHGLLGTGDVCPLPC